MSHILPSNTVVMGRSLCFHGAFGCTSSQVLPSPLLQTSRGGDENESYHPPMSQSRSLKTTSPCESRAFHSAFSVTLTQSGALGGSAAMAPDAQRRRMVA